MHKILIVGDMTFKRSGYCRRAVQQGHRILLASDAPQGLDLLRAEKPDCLILDHTIPRVETCATLKRLRRERSSVPVVVMTPATQNEARRHYQRLGVRKFVERPLDGEICHRMTEHVLTSARRWEGSYSPHYESCESGIELTAPPTEIDSQESESASHVVAAENPVATSDVASPCISLVGWPEKPVPRVRKNRHIAWKKEILRPFSALHRGWEAFREGLTTTVTVPRLARAMAMLFSGHVLRS